MRVRHVDFALDGAQRGRTNGSRGPSPAVVRRTLVADIGVGDRERIAVAIDGALRHARRRASRPRPGTEICNRAADPALEQVLGVGSLEQGSRVAVLANFLAHQLPAELFAVPEVVIGDVPAVRLGYLRPVGALIRRIGCPAEAKRVERTRRTVRVALVGERPRVGRDAGTRQDFVPHGHGFEEGHVLRRRWPATASRRLAARAAPANRRSRAIALPMCRFAKLKVASHPGGMRNPERLRLLQAVSPGTGTRLHGVEVEDPRALIGTRHAVERSTTRTVAREKARVRPRGGRVRVAPRPAIGSNRRNEFTGAVVAERDQAPVIALDLRQPVEAVVGVRDVISVHVLDARGGKQRPTAAGKRPVRDRDRWSLPNDDAIQRVYVAVRCMRLEAFAAVKSRNALEPPTLGRGVRCLAGPLGTERRNFEHVDRPCARRIQHHALGVLRVDHHVVERRGRQANGEVVAAAVAREVARHVQDLDARHVELPVAEFDGLRAAIVRPLRDLAPYGHLEVVVPR